MLTAISWEMFGELGVVQEGPESIRASHDSGCAILQVGTLVMTLVFNNLSLNHFFMSVYSNDEPCAIY